MQFFWIKCAIYFDVIMTSVLNKGVQVESKSQRKRYCYIMDRFLIKATFGSETLIRGRRGAYLRASVYKKKCGKAEDAQYS